MTKVNKMFFHAIIHGLVIYSVKKFRNLEKKILNQMGNAILRDKWTVLHDARAAACTQ